MTYSTIDDTDPPPSLLSRGKKSIHSIMANTGKLIFGNLQEYLRNADNFRKQLIAKSRKNEKGVSIESLGLVGGNIAAVVPSSQEQMMTLLNCLDQESKGRLGHAAFKFFSGFNSFIISDVGADATLHRKQLSRFLVPKHFVQPVIDEVTRTFSHHNQVMLRETVCNIIRAVTTKVILEVDTLPDNTYAVMKEYRQDTKTWSAFPLPRLLGLMPSLRKKRDAYHSFARAIIDSQFEIVVKSLQTMEHPEAKNLILTTIIDLIKKDYSHLHEEEFATFLTTLSAEDIRPYFDHDSVKTLPMLLKAADNLTDTLTLCLEKLSSDPAAIQRMREEIERNHIFSSGDIDIKSLINDLPYLDAWYKESLRMDTPTVVPRYTSSGIHTESIDIPPRTIILFDLHALNKGSKFWKEPNDFCPDRFLELSDNDCDVHSEQEGMKTLNQYPFIPFSAGLRMCPAFRVTEYIFKIFIAYTVNNFDLTLGEKCNDDLTLHIHPQRESQDQQCPVVSR